MNILNIEHISKTYGEKVIFDDVSCGIQEGEKVGIIGINGMGKTTLLRMIAGEEEPDEGQIIRQNGIKIAYLPQNPKFPKDATVLSYAFDGIEESDWTAKSEVKSVLNQLGITDHEAKIETLSGGQKKRVALAKTIATSFDVLLLDEPTNHLDVDAKEELKRALKEYRGTILLICHEPEFYQDIVSEVWDCSKWTTKIL